MTSLVHGNEMPLKSTGLISQGITSAIEWKSPKIREDRPWLIWIIKKIERTMEARSSTAKFHIRSTADTAVKVGELGQK